MRNVSLEGNACQKMAQHGKLCHQQQYECRIIMNFTQITWKLLGFTYLFGTFHANTIGLTIRSDDRNSTTFAFNRLFVLLSS